MEFEKGENLCYHSGGRRAVDLEKRRPIDLLPDAKVDTVETWLKEHPGIQIISRDPDTVFVEGRRGTEPEKEPLMLFRLLIGQ